MSNNWYLLLVIACFLSATSGLQAQQVVNIDFNRAGSGGQEGVAAAPDAAGATAIWNVTTGASPTASDLMDSSGTDTTVGITMSSFQAFSSPTTDNEQQSGHQELFSDYLSSRADNNQEDLRNGSWSGLVPGNTYDLYFYGQGDNFTGDGSFNSGQNVGVRIGTDVRHTSFDGTGRQLDPAGNGIANSSGDGSLVEDIEYVVFRGIVADATGTIAFEYFNPGQGLHATDTSFFDSDTNLADADNDPSRFSAINGVQIVGNFVDGQVLLGDVDLNGAVNFLDIGPFIAVLSGGIFQAEADVDLSGSVNFLDIGTFIAILNAP